MRMDPKPFQLAPRNKRRVPGLGEPSPCQHLASRVETPALARHRRAPRLVAASRKGWRNTVVAVHPAHLLDEVLRDAHVETEDRRKHVPIAILERPHVEVEAFEDR